MTDEELNRRFDTMVGLINNNHERLLLELRGVQTELRDIRAEQKATRTYIGARAGETETLITQLFDRLNARLDQTERSVEERLNKLEGKKE